MPEPDYSGRAVWFLRRMLSKNAPSQVNVLGNQFAIKRGVFNPGLSKATEFLAREIAPFTEGKSFLEVGVGCGAITISCLLRGATNAVATDLSTDAIKCTEENALKLGVESHLKLVQTARLDEIDCSVDVAFFALPYVYTLDAKRFARVFGNLAYAMFDEKYESQRSFLSGVPRLLKPDGRVFVGFSKIGNQVAFNQNLTDFGYSSYLVAVEKEGRADNRLYELKRSPDF